MGRIQRLTKLILVSTKSSISSNVSGKASLRRRHSFGEDEVLKLKLSSSFLAVTS
jgi:centromeric protein E